MSRKVKLGEQLTAIGVARRILNGAEKAPSSERERLYLADCLDAAGDVLRLIQANEKAARDFFASLNSGGASK